MRSMEEQLAFDQNVGRLKHERVTVQRDERQLLQEAYDLLHFHAPRKAILEVRCTSCITCSSE